MTANFDRLAPAYRTLEYLAFGRALERARTALLPALADAREVLLIGDGDGRLLQAFLGIAPGAHVTTVDASGRMLALARRRTGLMAHGRVTFVQADAQRWVCPPGRYDAIVTAFFLDCLPAAAVETLVDRLTTGLQAHGQWLFVDFALPAAGFRRVWFRLILRALYAFFQWQTGIEARTLPPSEAILARHGFLARRERTQWGGFIRSVLLARPEPPTAVR